MSRKKGLTLIETLLAMVILGIGLSILVSSAGRALSVVKRTRHFSTARHLFDIVELENPIPDIEEAAETTESGGFDAPNDAYTWTRTVEPSFDFEGEETGYFTIRTRVMWSDRGHQSYEELVTGVFSAADEKGARPDAEAMDAETAGGGGGGVPGGARGALPGGRGAPGTPGVAGGGRGGGQFPGMPGASGQRGMGARGAEGAGMGRGAGRAGAGRAFTAGGGQGGGRGGSRGGAAGGGGGGAPAGGGGGGGPPPPPGFR